MLTTAPGNHVLPGRSPGSRRVPPTLARKVPGEGSPPGEAATGAHLGPRKEEMAQAHRDAWQEAPVLLHHRDTCPQKPPNDYSQQLCDEH